MPHHKSAEADVHFPIRTAKLLFKRYNLIQFMAFPEMPARFKTGDQLYETLPLDLKAKVSSHY